jgi:hypothetical protein
MGGGGLYSVTPWPDQHLDGESVPASPSRHPIHCGRPVDTPRASRRNPEPPHEALRFRARRRRGRHGNSHAPDRRCRGRRRVIRSLQTGRRARHTRGERQDPPVPAAVHSHGQRRQPGARPGRLQGLARLREGQAGRGRVHHHDPAVHRLRPHRLQPDRRLAGRRRQPGRDGGLAPRQRLLGGRHQRQRLRLGRRPGGRPRRVPGAVQARQAPAVRLVGRGGARPGRLPPLRQPAGHR